jgi:hypothetical protein
MRKLSTSRQTILPRKFICVTTVFRYIRPYTDGSEENVGDDAIRDSQFRFVAISLVMLPSLIRMAKATTVANSTCFSVNGAVQSGASLVHSSRGYVSTSWYGWRLLAWKSHRKYVRMIGDCDTQMGHVIAGFERMWCRSIFSEPERNARKQQKLTHS